ncbi:hypothetical protein DFH94DRAFT_841588 [Russula ochroleuca]|uniref:Fungal STAND N-terminal Goodbye domain-containing protein n=1 Tax=Russula ochroleuca TaxID=152965 RepID=A0A9P5TEL6_9AGAM|nr:hypothetical protein DFH94DRAFT_841588 [Russula ochroleuca]
MSSLSSTSTWHSNIVSTFNAALEAYKRKTKKDLVLHPLLPRLQSCDSPEAIVIVLREQIPAFSQSRNGDDALIKWVTPTVFRPANAIFAGIGVLLFAAKDARASRDRLIDLFNRIEGFFRRLEIYAGITPTTAMRDIIIKIMIEILSILAIATNELKRGRLKKYMRKLTGNTEIDDSLRRLDILTREEARMAIAENLKMTHSVDDRVKSIDDRVMSIIDDKVMSIDDRRRARCRAHGAKH